MAYPSARNNNHGRSDHVVLIQVTSNVQITILRVAITKQPSLPCWFKALSEWQVTVPIPAPKCWHLSTTTTPLVIIIILHAQQIINNSTQTSHIKIRSRRRRYKRDLLPLLCCVVLCCVVLIDQTLFLVSPRLYALSCLPSVGDRSCNLKRSGVTVSACVGIQGKLNLSPEVKTKLPQLIDKIDKEARCGNKERDGWGCFCFELF